MISTPTLMTYKVSEFWPKNKMTVVEYASTLSYINRHLYTCKEFEHSFERRRII